MKVKGSNTVNPNKDIFALRFESNVQQQSDTSSNVMKKSLSFHLNIDDQASST